MGWRTASSRQRRRRSGRRCCRPSRTSSTTALIAGAVAARRSGGPGAERTRQRRSASSAMRDVARRVGNKKLEGEALQNLANALYFQRNFAGALQAYEAAADARTRARRSGRALLRRCSGIATIRYSFAEYGTALQHVPAKRSQSRSASATKRSHRDDAHQHGQRLVPAGRFRGRDRRLHAQPRSHQKIAECDRRGGRARGTGPRLRRAGRLRRGARSAWQACSPRKGAERSQRPGRRRCSASATCTSGSATSTARGGARREPHAFRGGQGPVARRPRLAGARAD